MSRTTNHARSLRKQSTPDEKQLWACLRNRQLRGLKFRRQHPLGTRIADFFCAEARLAIELDGSGHCEPANQAGDLDRELELHEKGIRVLRFGNEQIYKNPDWVLDAILYAADPEKSRWASAPLEANESTYPIETISPSP